MAGNLTAMIAAAFAGSAVTADPYYEYTTLLLPGNGTNGAQNNTFLDGSTNNFTITRNGNTTQGTFSPFSQTGWGNYFNGSNAYLSVANSTDLQLGNSDWDIECWVYLTSTSGNQRVISQSDSNYEFAFYLSSGSLTAYSFQSGGTQNFAISMGTLSANQWYHIAATRSGSTVRAFVNGTQIGSATFSGTIDARTGGWKVGASYTGSELLNGYISNLRIVKGSPVYTSAFTPPVSPLTAITNTSLLTCQSNRFIDTNTQTTPKTITVSGSPSVVAFSPFNPTSSWSATTNGGSGYFDGSGDYLRLNAGITELLLSNSDWSFDCWVYWTSSASRSILFCGQTDAATASGSSYFFPVTNASGVADIWVGTTNYSITAPAPALNTWAHIAYARTGGTVSSYLNGTRIGTRSDFGTSSINNGATTYGATVGASGTGSLFTGYMSSLRLIKGSGGYDATSSTITVPTAPLTAITNTSLLLNFTNGGIYDATSKNDLETVGDAQLSNTTAKWGSTSIKFDGTGDYLRVPDSPLFSMGSGNFTIDGWVYRSGSGAVQIICCQGGNTGSSTSFGFRINSSNQLSGFVYSGTTIYITNSTATVSANQWVYVAMVRDGNTITLYINGSADGTVSVTGVSVNDSAQPLGIGTYGDTVGDYFNGYIQDLRITRGYARTITTPTAAFPTL